MKKKKKKLKKKKIPPKNNKISRDKLEDEFLDLADKFIKNTTGIENEIIMRITRIANSRQAGCTLLVGDTLIGVACIDGKIEPYEVDNLIEAMLHSIYMIENVYSKVFPNLECNNFYLYMCDDAPYDNEDLYVTKDVFLLHEGSMLPREDRKYIRRLFKKRPEHNPKEPTCKVLMFTEKDSPKLYKLTKEFSEANRKLGEIEEVRI